jgi:predicted ATPase/DNA-binding winged helix-turn-helix (wHTH) protein
MSTEAARGVENEQGEVSAFGPFRLFPAARLLERDGKPVEIGARALDILIELVRHAGRVASKAELMSAIWADTTVVDGVLRTHMCNLRKALGDGVAGARYVTSVAGRGYCFVAPVVAKTATAASPNTWKVAHGLPLRLARMAGRDDAVRKLAAQLAEHRFVTVLGAAGIGKTTVAVAVGQALLHDFGGAVRFIELGSLTDPALVAPTVASTLGLPIQSDDALERLQAFLQDKRVLLVLDNCEHVVDAAARLTEHLFLRAPRVHLLTTSREALRVEGEHAHRLGPLETPDKVVGMNAEAIQSFAAVQIFLERAAASGWSGELTDGDVPIVAETCRRLDGVPLAIELAAGFVGRYGLQGIPALLDDRPWLLLQRGRRTASPRQRTINALIGWSYDRLPERERTVLRRLSVFVGTFSFDSVKAVVLDGGDSTESLPEVMNELVAKSLLSVIVEDGAVVYRLLETTRVYLFERLAESGEVQRVSLLHANLFTDRIERAADLGNVRAALKWSLSSPVGYAVGVRLAAAAARLLLDLGLVTECHDWCRKALDVMERRDQGTLVELGLVDALAASAMYSTRGLDADLRTTLSRGLELARALGSSEHQVRLLGLLNALLIRSGDWREALEVATQSMAAAPGSVRAHWMLALSHHCTGNHALAQEHCEEGLRIAANSREEPMMHFRHPQVLMTLARTLWLRGQPDQAVALARRVIDDESLLHHPVDKCVALLLGVPIFLWRGEYGEAERLVDVLTEHVERYSLESHRGVAMALRGALFVKTGRPQEGCTLLKMADSKLKAARNASHGAFVAAVLAEGLVATKSVSEALVTLEDAIEESQRRGGTRALPELLHLKGVALSLRSPTYGREVDATLSSAIELARRQGALAWELRATTALARERLRRGGAADVLRDLSAVYAKFTEGLETPDLQAARSLLERRVIAEGRGTGLLAALPVNRCQAAR